MYPLESFDTSSGATNGGWGDQWPNVSHQEASYPAQAPERAFSPLEDTFFSQSQSYHDPAAPSQDADPPSYSFLAPPPLMSPADHPQYARILFSFARVSPEVVDCIQSGNAGDDDFAAVGCALCGMVAASATPVGKQARITLAKLVYRQYVFMIVVSLALGLTWYVTACNAPSFNGMGCGGQ